MSETACEKRLSRIAVFLAEEVDPGGLSLFLRCMSGQDPKTLLSALIGLAPSKSLLEAILRYLFPQDKRVRDCLSWQMGSAEEHRKRFLGMLERWVLTGQLWPSEAGVAAA